MKSPSPLRFVFQGTMTSAEIRERFCDFFEKRGHRIVPSSSLIPDDPSVLLTTAGMQQFKKYYTLEADPIKDFGTRNTASVQKSFRTSDIDEVGDESHLTFFEMLGNFSFGGYFKKEAIEYAYEFIIKELGLLISYVVIFRGEQGVNKDEESREIWKSLGVTDIREEGIEDVFWGPTGTSGPCGPTTEVYCKNAEGKDIEIWNLVFNEFFYPGSREELLGSVPGKELQKLKIPGVDTGMGLERLAMVAQNKKGIFETDLFDFMYGVLPQELPEYQKRIITDHLRAAAFLLADGVRPSNKEAGYILRRLIRRILVYENLYKIPGHVFDAILHDVIHEYGGFYSELLRENEKIRGEFDNERGKFGKTLGRGIKEIGALAEKKFNEIKNTLSMKVVPGEPAAGTGLGFDGKELFHIYETYGFPKELLPEVIGSLASKYGVVMTFDLGGFEAEFKEHQEISRAGQERKFGGHGLLLDTGELKAKDEEELKKVTRLHTATHLLQAALRKVLGPEVRQMGSDITVERTRFDFSFPRKLTPQELKKVENLVNEVIAKGLPVSFEEMSFEDARSQGALHFFREKYPSRVKVYSVGDFSKEVCGGPHVTNTSEVGTFVILKEEAVAAGVRRIRAGVVS